jgi:hypothetical protein
MAGFQLATSADLSKWVDIGGGTAPEDIELCMQAATLNMIRRTGRDFERKAITETRHGSRADGASGEILRLSAAHAPIDLTVAPTVTENGVALTVASSYSASAQVLVDAGERNGALPGLPRLIRQGVAWALGTNNIVVTWTGGFAAPYPVDLIRCCTYLGWDISKTPTRMNKSSRSASQGGSTSFDPEWAKWVEECLEYWTLR